MDSIAATRSIEAKFIQLFPREILTIRKSQLLITDNYHILLLFECLSQNEFWNEKINLAEMRREIPLRILPLCYPAIYTDRQNSCSFH